MKLTHINDQGQAQMVDVTKKEDTLREAMACCEVIMRPETLKLIEAGSLDKGDVLCVARLGGIMGAKKTGYLIPLAHPITLTGISINLRLIPPQSVEIEATVRTMGKTGVEMEALTGAAITALTIYDMCKAVDRSITIQNLRLVSKTGGKSARV